MGTNEINQPKYKIGDYVSATDVCFTAHNSIITEMLKHDDIYLYKVNNHWFNEKNIYTNERDYQIGCALNRIPATQTYMNTMNDIIGLCEEKTNVLLGDKTELVIEFGEVDAIKYVDWDDTKGVKFSKLKLSKEVNNDDEYISWCIYDETENDWVNVCENYWDYIYVTIDIILTRELKNLLGK